jgi:hypothetical protein
MAVENASSRTEPQPPGSSSTTQADPGLRCAPCDDFLEASLTQASIEFVQLTDSQGILLLIPAAIVAHYKALGMSRLHFDVSIGNSPAREGWLTVTQAARQHLEDIPGMTLAQATAKISRACDTHKILSGGHGRDRRIEPTSFDAWRLAQRDRELDRADNEFL